MKEIKSMEDLKALEGKAVIRVYTTWCHACASFAKTFDKVAKGIEGIAFCRCNAEVAEDVVEMYDVLSVPTCLAVEGGKVKGRLESAVPAVRLEAWIKNELGVK